jgi:hypothetical protein
VVDTTTLAVCGATDLPISAPTEFRVGRSIGNPSSLLTEAWNAPCPAVPTLAFQAVRWRGSPPKC